MKYFGWEMKYLGWKMKLTISICEERTSGIKNICKGYMEQKMNFLGQKMEVLRIENEYLKHIIK